MSGKVLGACVNEFIEMHTSVPKKDLSLNSWRHETASLLEGLELGVAHDVFVSKTMDKATSGLHIYTRGYPAVKIYLQQKSLIRILLLKDEDAFDFLGLDFEKCVGKFPAENLKKQQDEDSTVNLPPLPSLSEFRMSLPALPPIPGSLSMQTEGQQSPPLPRIPVPTASLVKRPLISSKTKARPRVERTATVDKGESKEKERPSKRRRVLPIGFDDELLLRKEKEIQNLKEQVSSVNSSLQEKERQIETLQHQIRQSNELVMAGNKSLNWNESEISSLRLF